MQLPPSTNSQSCQSHQRHGLWRPYELESSPTMSDQPHTHQSNFCPPPSTNHMSTISQDGPLGLSTTSPGLPVVTQQSVSQRINKSSLSASNLESASGEVLTSSGTPQTQPLSDGSRHASPLSGKSTAWIYCLNSVNNLLRHYQVAESLSAKEKFYFFAHTVPTLAFVDSLGATRTNCGIQKY